MNRLGKIIVFAVAISIIGIGGYFVFRWFTAPTNQQNRLTLSDNQAGITATEAIKTLTDERLFDFWTNPKTEEVYYIGLHGQISKMNSDGSAQLLSSQTIPNLDYVNPTVDGSAVLIAFGYPTTPSFSIFNMAKRNFQPLPQGTTAADWNPQTNTSIAYLQNNGSSGKLSTLDLNTGKSTELLKINQKDLILDWAFPEIIYLYEKPTSQAVSSVWVYDIKSKTIKKLTEEKDFMVKWWTEKSLGLKWSTGKLSLVTKTNQQIASTDLKTLPYKCFFDEPFIYCSAPNDLSGAPANGLADRMLKKPRANDETIYAIISFNLGEKPLFSASKIFDSVEIGFRFRAKKIEKRNNRLLILNEDDNKLYTLPF